MNITTVRQKLTLLFIVPVVIRSPRKKTYVTYTLLDRAGEVTLLCDDVRKCLNLSGPTALVEIGSQHAKNPKFESYRVSFSVKSTGGRSELKISDAYSVPRPNLSKRPIQLDKVIR